MKYIAMFRIMSLLLGSYLHTSAGNIPGWVAIDDMLLR
jgi:hypothetical protein